VQRADILGARTFAMRICSSRIQMAATHRTVGGARCAARNNYLSALGHTKGSMVSVNLVANTDLRTAQEFRQLVVKEQGGVVVRLGDIADVQLGAENIRAGHPLHRANRRTFMGRLGAADPNTLRGHREKCREAIRNWHHNFRGDEARA